MKEVQRCLGCGSPDLRDYPALISGFIADYAIGGPRRRVRLLECRSCSLRFYGSRFGEEETRRLYSGYRGEAYYAARHAHEFWYTKKTNDSLGADPAEIRSRNRATLEFVAATTDPAGIVTVLDYGGDRGQFIPEGLGRDLSVFDVSGLAPKPGVSFIASERELEGRSFDLVLLANVLEHSSQPRDLLTALRRLARVEGSWFLVTVPLERPGLGFVPLRGAARRLYERFLDRAAASAWLGRAFDFYSAAFRVRFGLIPPLGGLSLHEHINFFDEPSLRAMLESSGFEVARCATLKLGTTGFAPSVLCLARATPPKPPGRGPNRKKA